MIAMKAVFTLFLVLLSGTAYGQSNLPACQGGDSSKWDDCYGTWIDSSGKKYAGVFTYGKLSHQKFNGQGTLTFPNGDQYVGDYENGQFNGQGKLTFADGRVFLGEWFAGKANGRLIQYSNNGSIEKSGIFKDDVLVLTQFVESTSFARIARINTVQDINLYEQSDLPACQGGDSSKWDNCYGTWIDSSGKKYANFFTNGVVSRQKFNRQGAFTYPNGDKYVGDYKDGQFNGQGTYINVNGEKYVGEWNNGNLNGQGIKFRANGSISESGIFKDDKLVTSQYIDPNSFKRIARNNSAPAVSDSQRLAEQRRELELETPQREQERKLIGAAFGKIILKTNPNKLPLCSERLATWQLTMRCWGEELRGRWNYVGEMNNVHGQGTPDGLGTWTDPHGLSYIGEFKVGKYNGAGILIFPNGSRQEGIWNDDQLVRKSKVNLPILNTTTANNAEQGGIEPERLRLAEERRKLDEDKRQRQQAKQISRISITATATQPDSSGVVIINIQTNTDTSSLKINGEELGGKVDGSYTVKKVARVGQETKFTIAGVDGNGNTDTKTITVSRTVVESKVTYQQLNPDRIKRQPERDAVAVIIGISNYKSLPKAEFAKDDAQVFYDYAIRALGVKPGNIKLLMDEQADAEEIYTAFKTWLPARVKSTTDVYVFYSGHGLPTQDGTGLYWLPQRANRDVISKTAILLQDISTDIQASKPKSVTIFMDACYSGQARGGETLVASARPIALKSQPTTFPSNFSVISASQADQISSSSPELQHGIFSYYLMRGMEGEADLNKDGKITLNETQAYLSENVGRHARIMNRQQEPQVIGDSNKILVGR